MKTKQCTNKKPLLVLRGILLIMLTVGMNAYSQNETGIWSDKTETVGMKSANRQIVPLHYRTVSADVAALKNVLSKAPRQNQGVNAKTSQVILPLPMPDGSIKLFSIVESPVMEKELAEKYPEIKTYLGQGVDDIAASTRCDITPKGFHAMIFTSDGTVFIDPYSKANVINYISYYKKDFIPPPDKRMPEYNPDDKILSKDITGNIPLAPSGTQLRTYRLALAADSNYYNFQGGTKPLTMAAMVTSINRVNFVYEREVAIHMNIIAGDDQLIFPGTTSPYPYTVTAACALRPENQTKIDAVIGSANYDIGHLFAMSAGGCAIGNSVCNAATKAYGVTGTANPVGDPFDIDYVCHEMGHQFNAGHTWNGTQMSCTAGQYDATSSYEPGSGTTIMGYAGICGTDNLQPNSDPYFHTRSFDAIVAYSTTGTGNSCPVTTATGNAVPTVNAGANFTIPISTPFILTGSGNDPNSDPLTFCWEEFDLGPSGPPNVSTTTGPVFRSFNPVTSPSRTFPKLSDILNNTTTIGEILPSITRTMTFRLTARDNHAGGGGVNYASMTLNVTATAGPFAVTAPNAATTWCPGPHTVTWSVNGADALAANVNILLSMDGGNTFPVTLASNTPNDGSQSVTIPCGFSNTARIKVEAVGNIFFDISNANFTVGDNTKPTFTVPANIIISKDANCNYNASSTITGDVTDEADNCSTGLNATFTAATVPGTCVGETKITRTWTLTDGCSNSTVKVQTITIKDVTPPTFTAPANITIYKDDNCNHDASVSKTGDVTNEADNCDNTLDAIFSDVKVNGSCIGEEIITRTWSLTDDCGNNTMHGQVITVKDTTRPVISNENANPSVLWPPNHKMINITIGYDVHDNCSPVSAIINMISVSSNESVNGSGDGNTSPDWQVIDAHHVKLRAERSGNGTGRIYTITIKATDNCGNVATKTVTVLVPHDMSTAAAVMHTYSVEEMNTVEGLTVRATPNPTTDNFTIQVSSNNSKDRITISVFDLYGRIREEKIINNEESIRLGNDFRPGVYLIRIMQGDRHKEMKLIKLSE